MRDRLIRLVRSRSAPRRAGTSSTSRDEPVGLTCTFAPMVDLDRSVLHGMMDSQSDQLNLTSATGLLFRVHSVVRPYMLSQNDGTLDGFPRPRRLLGRLRGPSRFERVHRSSSLPACTIGIQKDYLAEIYYSTLISQIGLYLIGVPAMLSRFSGMLREVD